MANDTAPLDITAAEAVAASGRRVLVVGAGPGGLATAMLLRAAGAEVTLLEKEDTPGGRTGAIREDGYTFDIGPTFFLYPEILREIFSACGRDFDEEVELIRLDPMYRLQFDDGRKVDATPDSERLAAEIARLSPKDAGKVAAYLEENRAKFDAFRPILQRPFLGPRDVMRGDMIRALPKFRPWSTVDGELHRWFEDPDVRVAFSFQSKYLGMSPFKCPSLFTIIAHVEYGFGVFHPKGGCNAITAAMARVAGEMGVDVRLGEPVERLSMSGRRATGAVTAKGTYEADAVVMNADFAHAMTTLVPDAKRRRWTDKRLAAKDYSCSTFMLYLGLEEKLDLQHHTIAFSSDYARNVSEIDAGQAPDDPTIYIQNASRTDPTLAPEGHSALYILAPVGNLTGGVDWDALAPSFREKILDRVAKLAGRDIRPLIRYEKMFTPDDWRSKMAVYEGATFNLAHNLGQMLHMRPRNRFEDIDGVYLTGGGTHPGSGLPTIFESARIASRLCAEDLGLPGAGELTTTLPKTSTQEAAE
ncbi:phytoene desaturase family protein [Roseicyclus sp. F158]|uniref:Phytoene desaturase family protein n=1 Tax=Tropicimonas omnivorans TaxID=3075590 RepID=A0ABU3DLF4_9RHOB|nr:phytoene desaturase family protein [Roseicyclus sp. F158]MDT0684433.1 phytoene desaturase family protein [Roseicyclus sp. F158]